MTAVITERATGRSLVPPELFGRLVRRIVADEHLDADFAERVVDQALAFLGTCARPHTRALAPSEPVDPGWHAFILHTREYGEFCQGIAGRFLHHVPTEAGDAGAHGEAARATLARTVAAIEAAGFVVDYDLWPQTANVSCTGCHQGCHDDPPPPPAN
jgi:hypothetical protein